MDPIDRILVNEGGSKVTNDPVDGGGRTQYGISEKSNPGAWADGVVTEAEARAIYQKKYVDAPGFNKIDDKQLRTQLIDFGVNSGPAIAIQKLQSILNVTQDGILGRNTLESLALCHSEDINNLLVGERCKMIANIVSKNPSQVKFLVGWINRAVDFLL
jgi:lysozyme family protein